MSTVLINGEPPPACLGIRLEMDMEGARAFWTRRTATGFGFESREEIVARLPRGARVEVDGRIVHVEGALEALTT